MTNRNAYEHERIWLEPAPGTDEEYGRLWMHENVWGDEAVEYVRADLVEKTKYDRVAGRVSPSTASGDQS